MPRPEKVQAVTEIKERIERARAVFLAEYAGLSVKDQQTLRRSLRQGGAEFKVVKMTLARRAAAELELEGLDELLLGPTGLTFADGDAVTAAKALKDFAKDHEVFAIKGGLLGTDFLTPERVSELAEIEPRDVLLARIAGAAKAPMANLAGLLQALPRNLASALSQLVEKKESGEAPAPADEAASDDAAEEETAPAAEADVTAEAADTSEEDSAEAATSEDDSDASEAASAEATDAEDADTSEAPEDSDTSDASAAEPTGSAAEETEDVTSEGEADEADAADADASADGEEE